MAIRIIGLDLDGTLLDEHKCITPRTQRALSAAMAQGVVVVPVTGRPYTGIPQAVMQLPALRYLITSNGATIRDAITQRAVLERHLSTVTSLQILEALSAHEVLHEAFWNGLGYSEQRVYDALCERHRHSPLLPYIKETRRAVTQDLSSFLRDGDKCAEEIWALTSSPEQKERILSDLKSIPDLHFVFPSPSDLEITAYQADKGEALLYLAQCLGISPSETMAFGDSGNDLSLLKKAALPVAMGNACVELKEVAQHITASNEADGVALAVERFVLGYVPP